MIVFMFGTKAPKTSFVLSVNMNHQCFSTIASFFVSLLARLSPYDFRVQVFGREQDTLTAVPSFLYYILREVLKNSCRATVDHGHLTRPGEKLPPVKVIGG